MNDSQASVKVDKLSFSYGQRQALRDISFNLYPGITMLLGPNGAGKSTLFALLTQLYRQQQGEIRFANEPLKQLSHRANAKLGVVFQQHTLDMDMNVSQNLCYFGALHGLNASSSLAQAIPLLSHFGLDDRLQDKVRTLNTGHKRRLEIVRALMHSPAILLLDEPSAGLDPAGRRSLMQTVREYCTDHRVAVLWATHLLDEPGAEDQLLILHQGQLLASGQCQALIADHGLPDLPQLFAHLTEEPRP